MDISKQREFIWPSVIDTTTAQNASKQGLWASAFCAGATIVFVVLAQLGAQMFNFDMWALLDAFLFVVIGWGIYKMNRIAAIAGLILYILERISMWSEHGAKNPAIAIFITLMFINSIRGTFAYHKINKSQT